MFKNIRDDFVNNGSDVWSLGFWAMVVYRFGRWRYRIPFRSVRIGFSFLYKLAFFFCKAFGIELPCEVEIGKNFRIDHQGGIVVSGYASFGDDCVIRNGVTIGLRHANDPTAPTIKNRVDIGSGAKILGKITIGNNVTIGANAVVIKDVPSDSIAVGIPAKIIGKM